MICKNLLLHKSNKNTGKDRKKSTFWEFWKLTKGLQAIIQGAFIPEKQLNLRTASFTVFELAPFLSFENQQPNSFTGGRTGLELTQKPHTYRTVIFKPVSQVPGKALFTGFVSMWPESEITHWEKPFPQDIC